MPTDRVVRFTEQFFTRLELLLPEDRGADGIPSVTDFLVFDLPAVHAMLARDMEAATLPSGEPDIRVYVGFGGMVGAFAIHVRLADDGVVEAFWLALEPMAW